MSAASYGYLASPSYVPSVLPRRPAIDLVSFLLGRLPQSTGGLACDDSGNGPRPRSVTPLNNGVVMAGLVTTRRPFLFPARDKKIELLVAVVVGFALGFSVREAMSRYRRARARRRRGGVINFKRREMHTRCRRHKVERG
jgi:hypothetical protein